MASRVSLATSRNAGCREKMLGVFGSSLAHYGAQVTDRCDSGQNKTQTFSKSEQASFSASHKRPALMQPVCTAVSNPCHVGRGLAGHPRCVSVGNEHGKTRLFVIQRRRNLHTQLPRRLAHFGPIAGGFDIAQDPPPQPLRLPGAQSQLCQECTVTQPTGIVPGYSYQLGVDDSYCLSGASHLDLAPRGFLQGRHRPSAQSFPEDAGPYGSGFAGTSAGSVSYATHPVLVETEGSSSGLASRTPPRNGDSGLYHCILYQP